MAKLILAILVNIAIAAVLGWGIWLLVPNQETGRESNPWVLIFGSAAYTYLFIKYGCLR